MAALTMTAPGTPLSPLGTLGAATSSTPSLPSTIAIGAVAPKGAGGRPATSAGAPGADPSGSGAGSPTRRITNRMTNRYSVNAMYSLAAEQDVEVEDELARAQKRLRDLKTRISSQSKKNFVLERDVRYLDSRIGLLIQNRIAADEKRQVQETLEDVNEEGGAFPDSRKLSQYSNLFFLLQSEPRHVASLCRLVSLTEIDTLLQTVMFTLYGNQYEQREEHLLLTMFQVSRQTGPARWLITRQH